MHAHPDAHDFGAGMALLLAACGAALVAYVVAAGCARRWSRWRTASFAAGMIAIIAALLPPVVELGHRDIRVHMVQHVLLGMLGPVGVVLGAPVTLALRTLPRAGARRLVRALHAQPLRWLAHPASALVLSVGGMAALYATPLFDRAMAEPGLHFVLHVHFLVAGCLFAWAIAGVDPGPARPGRGVRLAVLFVAIAAHATLAKAMYARTWPPHTGHSRAHIQQAAQIMYYGGDLSEAMLAIALFATWRRRDRTRRGDRHLLAPAAKPDTLCT